jgi:hypothetical protein
LSCEKENKKFTTTKSGSTARNKKEEATIHKVGREQREKREQEG